MLHIELAPFDAVQAGAARAAYVDFGTGSGHPAGLNFGDCLAYGLAKVTGQPLLYVGDNFTQTDLRSALGADRRMNTSERVVNSILSTAGQHRFWAGLR